MRNAKHDSPQSCTRNDRYRQHEKCRFCNQIGRVDQYILEKGYVYTHTDLSDHWALVVVNEKGVFHICLPWRPLIDPPSQTSFLPHFPLFFVVRLCNWSSLRGINCLIDVYRHIYILYLNKFQTVFLCWWCCPVVGAPPPLPSPPSPSLLPPKYYPPWWQSKYHPGWVLYCLNYGMPEWISGNG